MYALFYDYVENIVDKRAPFREAHLALAREWKADGKLTSGGALGDPPHSALLVFDVDDEAEVEAFVDSDPYVANGLVTQHRSEFWNVVV